MDPQSHDIKDFYTAKRYIEIIYPEDKKAKDKKSKDKKDNEPINAKIILATNDENFEKLSKFSQVRIYFFVHENKKDSSCFEFDPFSRLVNFRKENDHFIFSKKIPAFEYSQQIILERSNDCLDAYLEEIYNCRAEDN